MTSIDTIPSGMTVTDIKLFLLSSMDAFVLGLEDIIGVPLGYSTSVPSRLALLGSIELLGFSDFDGRFVCETCVILWSPTMMTADDSSLGVQHDSRRTMQQFNGDALGVFGGIEATLITLR